MSAPEGWRPELIPFPFEFAPDIDLVGFEDIRFAPGWSDAESEQFWMYSFVWYVDAGDPMTEDGLADLFHLYYDGLMSAVLKGNGDSTEIENSLSLFVKTEEGFTGKIRMFDAFFSKEYITLNIKVEETFCPSNNKQIVAFDLSPKPFDDELWKQFEEIEIIVECN
ncbi:MAG: hypothetical protein AAGC88_07820 [Bacteroidota bacterium]